VADRGERAALGRGVTTAPVEGGPVSLFGVDIATYRPHAVHLLDRTYVETNCYTDVLIELLHARGDEPLAAMGFTVRTDFEGDQWTFFKPPPGDLEALFGVDIHEMQPYRPVHDQIAEQIASGNTVIVEVDSWYLPDTAATSYRTEHVKTSIAAESINRAAEVLRYFHNAGVHELEGDDYRGVFRLKPVDAEVLPPYTELVRLDAGPRLEGEELRSASRDLLRHHLGRRPSENPFEGFADSLEGDLPALLAGDSADYHAYAFATVRMAGSAFELCASHLDWLLADRARTVSGSLRQIVDACKLLSLKLARRRPFESRPVVVEMGRAWEHAMTRLDDLV
jgi:hypothetical protein